MTMNRVIWQQSTYSLAREYHTANWSNVAQQLATQYGQDTMYGYHCVELELWRIASTLRAELHCQTSKSKTYYNLLGKLDALLAIIEATYPKSNTGEVA